MLPVETELGRLDLTDKYLHYPYLNPLPIRNVDVFWRNGQAETIYKFGSFPEVLYTLFPHLAGTGVAETIHTIATAVRPVVKITPSVEFEYGEAPFLIAGSIGKMIAASRRPYGFFTPRKIFGVLARVYPQVVEFECLAQKAIDVDFRFSLQTGYTPAVLEEIVLSVIKYRRLPVVSTAIVNHFGSHESLDVTIGDWVKLDLGTLPPFELKTQKDNTRMSFPNSSKDQFAVAFFDPYEEYKEHMGVKRAEGVVSASEFGRVQLECEDVSLGIDMADLPQAVVVGLRASLNRIFYPPKSLWFLDGGHPLLPYLELTENWKRFRSNSENREKMFIVHQGQITKGFLFNILCDPKSLRLLKQSHVLDQVLLGDWLPKQRIEEFLQTVRLGYSDLFKSGKLTASDCGLVKLAEFLNIDLPDLLPLFQLKRTE